MYNSSSSRTSNEPEFQDANVLYISSSNSTSSTAEQIVTADPYRNRTLIDEQLTQPTPLSKRMLRDNEMLEIKVHGIPNSGAKSRVETQTKLCIQLLTQRGQKVVGWSYIQLKEDMLARSRFRRASQQHPMDGSVATMVSDESKVLQLEAKVVCTSNTDHPIRMCIGCVRREKKRAERTKSNEKTTWLQKDLEAERDRILLFNCAPMVSFSSGDAILPTRITCYCRHHHEKIGFRISFKMRNYKGQVIATGISPPIMITDDHKSLKQSSARKRSMTPDFSRRESIMDTPLQTPSTDIDVDIFQQSANYMTSISQELHNVFPQNSEVKYRQHVEEITPVFHHPTVPQVERLIPTEGPLYGGMDITLLGSGFYRGLTCLFGERPATTTFWNANTLVCVLPPAIHTGPVVVSFQEHPLMIEGQDVPIFTYRDSSDQALYELALQVVGIKMTGRLQDPKQVAMHIVQGVPTRKSNHHHQQLLDALDTSLDLSIQNTQGHTLLHLAVLLNDYPLVQKLIQVYQHRPLKERLLFFDKQDRNDMTALHFACQQESLDIVRLLVNSGASSIQSKYGFPSQSCGSREIINYINKKSNTIFLLQPSCVYFFTTGKGTTISLYAFQLNRLLVTLGLFFIYVLGQPSIFDYTPQHIPKLIM